MRREGRIAGVGLYPFVRHPQYAGIVFTVFDRIVHWPTIITVALFPVMVLVYVRLACVEERKMLKQFGERYRDYVERVPMFFPRWDAWRRLVTAPRDSIFPG